MRKDDKNPNIETITICLPKPMIGRLRQLKKEGKIVSISEAVRNGLWLWFDSHTYVSREPATVDQEAE